MEHLKPTTAFSGTLLRRDRPARATADRPRRATSHAAPRTRLRRREPRCRCGSPSSCGAARPPRRTCRAARTCASCARGGTPRVVTLVKCLCRFVWSEHTHDEERERDGPPAPRRSSSRRRPSTRAHAPSAETEALRIETERKEDAAANARIEVLRAAFTAADDQVNLLWLDYRLEDITDLAEMATKSQLPDRRLLPRRRPPQEARRAIGRRAAAGSRRPRE